MAAVKDQSTENQYVKDQTFQAELLVAALSVIAIGYWLWRFNIFSRELVGIAGAALLVATYCYLSRDAGRHSKARFILATLELICASRFYSKDFFSPAPSLVDRLILSSSVFLVGGYLLLVVYPYLRHLIQRLGEATVRKSDALALCAGWCVISLFVSDFFFIEPIQRIPSTLLKFHPWATFDKEGSYLYANAKEHFVRDLRGQRFSQVKQPGEIRVVLNGASTMWGHNLTYEQSPPGVLERLLKARYSDRNFKIITVAHPGYYQLNELIDTVVTVPHWNPDIVISWNGINELWYGENPNRYEGMPNNAEQVEQSVTASIPLFWLATHTGSFAFKHFYGHWLSSWKSSYTLKEPVNYERPRYFSYLEETGRALKHHRIPYVYSFCPNLAEKRILTPAESQAVAPGWAREARRRAVLARAIVRREGEIAYDAMTDLAESSEELFMDSCHLNPRGVEISMRYVADHLLEWLGRARRKTNPPQQNVSRSEWGLRSFQDASADER